MGRYSKKRKQEEARIRAEDAKKTFVENILEFSEKQQEELERLERRINRKKIRSVCRIQPGQSSVRKNVKRNIKMIHLNHSERKRLRIH